MHKLALSQFATHDTKNNNMIENALQRTTKGFESYSASLYLNYP